MKLVTLLWANFPPPTVKLLKQIGQLAHEQGTPAYLVGGVVRDILLGVPTVDVDIMVEGDAIAFARALKDNWSQSFPDLLPPEKLVRFPRYGTAKLIFLSEVVPGLQALDFSTARSEDYPVPGMPPVIAPGDLTADLRRRDFSVNAMAVGLSGPHFGTLFDLHEGERHLERRELAVLHERSFLDDPARLIRGVRFAARFDFSFAPDTASMMREAATAGHLLTLPPARRFEEFRKALAERRPVPVLSRLAEEQLLEQLIPGARFDEGTLERMEQLATHRSGEHAELFLAALLHDWSDDAVASLLLGFGRRPAQVEKFLAFRRKL